MIRCSYSKKYKATKAPTCGCLKCEAKWAMKGMVRMITGRYHVSDTPEEVGAKVVAKLKKDASDVVREAVRELAEMYHRYNIAEYGWIMNGLSGKKPTLEVE